MMSGETIRVPYRELDEFTESVLTKLGIPPEDARTVVEVLSQANLRGVGMRPTCCPAMCSVSVMEWLTATPS